MLTKLRSCNNKLPITVGRYNNIRREDRIFEKCNARVIGDEYHAVLCEKMKKSQGLEINIFLGIIEIDQVS